MSHHRSTLLSIAILTFGGTASLEAAPPGPAAEISVKSERGFSNPYFYWDLGKRSLARVQQPEIVEMLLAIAGGSGMGPGQGWFHPGQSRYDWDWLAARFDKDHDGTITREEFQGPDDLFNRLDRNGDGALTKDDFDWSERSSHLRQAGMAGQVFRMIDSNSNGRISKEEWEAFFTRAAKGKAYLSRDDLLEALRPPAPKPAKDKSDEDGPSPIILIQGLINGAHGSFHEGPKTGQKAPDFTLKTQDDKRQIRLSEFRGKKPVVLIFGSFT